MLYPFRSHILRLFPDAVNRVDTILRDRLEVALVSEENRTEKYEGSSTAIASGAKQPINLIDRQMVACHTNQRAQNESGKWKRRLAISINAVERILVVPFAFIAQVLKVCLKVVRRVAGFFGIIFRTLYLIICVVFGVIDRVLDMEWALRLTNAVFFLPLWGTSHLAESLRKLNPYLYRIQTDSVFAEAARISLKKYSLDVVIAHDSHSLLAASKVAEENGAAMVCDILEVDNDRSGAAFQNTPPLLIKWQQWRQRRLLRRATMSITVGSALGDWASKYYRIQTPEVVRNCCVFKDLNEQNRIKADLGLDEEQKLGVVLGAIYRNQGIEELIHSLAGLPEHIHIAAIGPEAERGYLKELKALRSTNPGGERFHVIPPCPPENVIDYISGADIGIIARQNTCLNNYYCLPQQDFRINHGPAPGCHVSVARHCQPGGTICMRAGFRRNRL